MDLDLDAIENLVKVTNTSHRRTRSQARKKRRKRRTTIRRRAGKRVIIQIQIKTL